MFEFSFLILFLFQLASLELLNEHLVLMVFCPEYSVYIMTIVVHVYSMLNHRLSGMTMHSRRYKSYMQSSIYVYLE